MVVDKGKKVKKPQEKTRKENVEKVEMVQGKTKKPKVEMVQGKVTKPKMEMVMGEVAWKTANTFDIFEVLWKKKAKPIAGQRKDLAGMTYNKVLLPSASIARIQQSLLKVDPHVQLYLV